MDFRKLSNAMSSAQSPTNSSEPLSITDLSPNILDKLIPGYGIISNYIQTTLGVDISLFVTLAIVALAVTKGGHYLAERSEKAFRWMFMSTVYVDEHDDLFDMVMGWLAEHQGPTSRRSVRAKTPRGAKAQDESYDASADDALDENGMFDYNKWSARTAPRFEPYYGRHMLRHDGRWFNFRRLQNPAASQRLQIQFGSPSDDDMIQIDCIGRSIAPIEALLRTVKVWSLARLRHTTTIRHPTPKDRARFGGMWSKTSSRPSRPMDTVILDGQQKSMVIKDMNEYLHPASPKWYATRGIPYRRGYLFHGPPGTGKTSLSFALAGIFGLEIYAISLQDPTLTEGDLMQLFNGLPRRCIVLLEDVDAAGLKRDGTSDKANTSKKHNSKAKDEQSKGGDAKESSDKSKPNAEKKPKKDEDYTLRDLARELKSISAPKPGTRGGNDDNGKKNTNNQVGTGISLSGLLNAIDGVASHEGRVLIMTTNQPEKLDSALVRPGRVDRRVGFRLAMKEQVRELFVRMYAATEGMPSSKPRSDKRARSEKKGGGAVPNGHPPPPGTAAVPATDYAGETDQLAAMSPEDLEAMAAEFARAIPDDTFTPAEIQNHLMRYKEKPRTALETSGEWMRELLDEKERLQAAEEEEGEQDGDGAE